MKFILISKNIVHRKIILCVNFISENLLEESYKTYAFLCKDRELSKH